MARRSLTNIDGMSALGLRSYSSFDLNLLGLRWLVGCVCCFGRFLLLIRIYLSRLDVEVGLTLVELS